MNTKTKTERTIEGVLFLLLLLGLVKANYGYYQALRTLISFGFAFMSFTNFKKCSKRKAFVFLALLIVYQPLFSLALGRELWVFLDIVVACFIAYDLFSSFKVAQGGGQITNAQRNSAATPSIQDEVEKVSKEW